jgi:translation initiation factor 1
VRKKRDPALRQQEYSLVYSTSEGRICPHCSQPVGRCACTKARTLSPGDGIVRISHTRKGRKGKGVTILSGIPLDHEALKELAQKLKQRCGAGGTLREGTVEIQGDHRTVLAAEMKKLGFSVKYSGG